MCLGGTCFILFLCNLSREIQILIIFICSYFVDLLSGTYCLLSYASFIFDEAGSSLSPNVSAIILGSIQMFGVYFSTILVDRTGRKFLMISSAICCSLGLALFSIYDYLKHSEMDVTGYNWVPLASCAFVIFVANLGTTNLINCRFSTIFNFFFFTGVVSLPFLILTEVTPIKINGVIYGFNLTYSWFLAFLTLQVSFER